MQSLLPPLTITSTDNESKTKMRNIRDQTFADVTLIHIFSTVLFDILCYALYLDQYVLRTLTSRNKIRHVLFLSSLKKQHPQRSCIYSRPMASHRIQQQSENIAIDHDNNMLFGDSTRVEPEFDPRLNPCKHFRNFTRSSDGFRSCGGGRGREIIHSCLCEHINRDNQHNSRHFQQKQQ